MAQVRTYQDLEVWKKSRELVKQIYAVTKSFPQEEQFGLTNQLRRSAISVASNIAEGSGRAGVKDSTRFFYIARGSLYEIETQMVLATDLQYISDDELDQVQDTITSCKKLLNGLIKYFMKMANHNVNEPSEDYIRDFPGTSN